MPGRNETTVETHSVVPLHPPVNKNILPAYSRFGVQESSPIDVYNILLGVGLHPQTAW
jgi:hypothetical protein